MEASPPLPRKRVATPTLETPGGIHRPGHPESDFREQLRIEIDFRARPSEGSSTEPRVSSGKGTARVFRGKSARRVLVDEECPAAPRGVDCRLARAARGEARNLRPCEDPPSGFEGAWRAKRRGGREH